MKQLCTVIQDTILYNIFVTNSDQLQFSDQLQLQCFRLEVMNQYNLHNHKFMTIFFLVAIEDKNFISAYHLVLQCTIAWYKEL